MQKAEKGDLGAAVDALTLLENSGIRDEDSLKHGRRLRDLGRHGISRTSPEKWYDVWERSMRWLAFSEFETFMEYLEIDRPEESRFWIPRRKPLARVATALQDVADGKLDELIINLPPRTGKLLADDTPVLTTKGWKNHGDLVVGDYVFSPDGKPTKVIAVHPKHHTTHTVTISDGSKFECHFRHEWRVFDRADQSWKTIETQQIAKRVSYGPKEHVRDHRYRYQIEIPKPLQGMEKALPVPPYVFGAWLGDGSNRQPRINGDKRDRAIVDRIESCGYKVVHTYAHKTTGVITYDFNSHLRKDLQELGFCYTGRTVEKGIPEEYLTASLEQRLQLLAGLIDTDGTLVRKEHRYKFTTSEQRLRDDVETLVTSFGWRVHVQEYKPKTSSSGIVGKKPYWVVSFNPTFEIPCVLERKQLTEFSKQRRMSIISIEESEHKQGNCITVERDGMYLVGKHLTPTHNTSITMFWLVWMMGRDPEKSHLYTSFSDTVTSAFYRGVREIVEDPYTYRYADIFPLSPVVSTNAKDNTLDLQRKKRYSTLTCRSIDGTLNGACDASGAMIGDDLCSGIEEAKSPSRMDNLNAKVNNDWLSRRKQGCPVVWMGTRWSLQDPMGRREKILTDDANFQKVRWRKVSIPALDSQEQSNFVMPYGVGFSRQDYRRIRAQFERDEDMASWLAMYQQQPVERQGAVFDPAKLRTFSGDVPEGRVFMAVDPAFGGGDFTAAPICVDTGEDVYIPAVVFSDAEKDITMPLLADAVLDWKVEKVQFEANKMLQSYVDEFRRLLRARGIRITVTSQPASTRYSKADRIHDKAPDIRRHFLFLEPNDRPRDYTRFMQQVYAFTSKGGMKHDDAPDSLAMAASMVYRFQNDRAEVFRRPI